MIPQFNPLSSFYPLSLFANGEPGFWLDPSDLSTMYQDSAGTTPVTAVEQPVGLILDKSKGLVLGSELVTNGGPFTNTSGWANTTPANGTLSASGGLLTFTTTNIDFATFAITTVVGKWYKVAATIASAACPGFYAIRKADDTAVTTNIVTFINTSTGSGGGYFLATATTSYIVLQINGAGTASISLASCKSLAGTHYYQSTAGVRPVLSARVNLLTKTEALANAAWSKIKGGTGVTPVATDAFALAPDGTLTASRVQLSVAAGTAGTDYSAITQSGTTIVGSNNRRAVWLMLNSGTSAVIDLSDGGGDSNITVTNAWQLFYVDRVADATGRGMYLGIQGNTGTAKTVDLLVWHPDYRPVDQATGLIPTYQRVNTSTDYDTAGFPLYLSGNGTQWMQCAAQDYTGVNKMLVCGGVRSINTTDGMSLEIGNVGVTNGSLLFGEWFSSRWYFGARNVNTPQRYATTYPQPITSVLSCAYDLAAATIPTQITPRVNTATPTLTDTGSAATPGTFGNVPGYLFCRAGTSLFFTGNIYQLIARGSTVASNAAQIAATENWTDLKTKAY